MRSSLRRRAFGMGIIGALAALAASAPGSPPPQAAATAPPCFAYILDGDVWFRCNSQTHRVTTQGDITDFAISEDTVAWGRSHEEEIESYPLNGQPGPNLDPRGGPSRLYASCGTILHVRYGYDERGLPTGVAVAVLEVPGAKPLKMGSYSEFRCSSDRGVVVGTTDGGSTLTEGVPPGQLLAEPSPKYWYLKYRDYDVSPSGSYIAYSAPEAIYVRTDARTVGEIHGGIADRISVSDAGELLYTTNWWEQAAGQPHICSYKDPWHASLQPRPGYTEGDLCQAVAMWHPGLREPEILVPLARHPQWISAKTAERLAAWHLR